MVSKHLAVGGGAALHSARAPATPDPSTVTPVFAHLVPKERRAGSVLICWGLLCGLSAHLDLSEQD